MGVSPPATYTLNPATQEPLESTSQLLLSQGPYRAELAYVLDVFVWLSLLLDPPAGSKLSLPFFACFSQGSLAVKPHMRPGEGRG